MMRRNEVLIARRASAIDVRIVTPTEDVTVRLAPTSDRRRIYTDLPIYTNDPARSMSRRIVEALQRQALESMAREIFRGADYTLERSNTGDWIAVAEAAAETDRRDYRMSANAGYYVWPLGREGRPLRSEGPFGPYELDTARTTARIRATKGRHDYAVTRGKKFSSEGTVRRYHAGSGESDEHERNPKLEVGDEVTLPKGFTVGMGHLKEDTSATVDAVQLDSEGNEFYRLVWTDRKGKRRTAYLGENESL
jgi:hypothetical protein